MLRYLLDVKISFGFHIRYQIFSLSTSRLIYVFKSRYFTVIVITVIIVIFNLNLMISLANTRKQTMEINTAAQLPGGGGGGGGGGAPGGPAGGPWGGA